MYSHINFYFIFKFGQAQFGGITSIAGGSEKYKAQAFNDFTVFSTQAVGALSAGYFLNMINWQTINLICLPFLAIIALVIWSADRMETSKNLRCL